MTTEQAPTPNQNDRIMAALAHISALLPFMGVIAPIIIWVTQKDKSEYIAFQALQAVAYQLIMILAWFVGIGCYMLSFFSMFLTIPFAGDSSGPVSRGAAPFFLIGTLFPFIIFGLIFVGGFLFVIYGIVGAVQVFRGKDFRYIFLGNKLTNYLKRNP